MLSRKAGDHPEIYKTAVTINPLDGKRVLIIAPREDGSNACRYLGEKGCTIHEVRPAICRTFSCVFYYQSKTRAERKRIIDKMPSAKALFDRGRELSGAKK